MREEITDAMIEAADFDRVFRCEHCAAPGMSSATTVGALTHWCPEKLAAAAAWDAKHPDRAGQIVPGKFAPDWSIK